MGELDVEAVTALLADDFVLELPFRADGGPRRMDSDQARAFIRAMPTLLAEMPFHDVVVHGALSSGEIVAEYRSDGVTRSGRPYQNRYVAFFTVLDGRIARWREFFDPTAVTSAFGRPRPPT
jgi:ketosteroid isomerase-like protein